MSDAAPQLSRTQRFIITVLALAILAVLETVALLKGIDGQLFTAVIAGIAGIGAFAAGKIKAS